MPMSLAPALLLCSAHIACSIRQPVHQPAHMPSVMPQDRAGGSTRGAKPLNDTILVRRGGTVALSLPKGPLRLQTIANDTRPRYSASASPYIALPAGACPLVKPGHAPDAGRRPASAGVCEGRRGGEGCWGRRGGWGKTKNAPRARGRCSGACALIYACEQHVISDRVWPFVGQSVQWPKGAPKSLAWDGGGGGGVQRRTAGGSPHGWFQRGIGVSCGVCTAKVDGGSVS